jgi:hypothetical protein
MLGRAPNTAGGHDRKQNLIMRYGADFGTRFASMQWQVIFLVLLVAFIAAIAMTLIARRNRN